MPATAHAAWWRWRRRAEQALQRAGLRQRLQFVRVERGAARQVLRAGEGRLRARAATMRCAALAAEAADLVQAQAHGAQRAAAARAPGARCAPSQRLERASTR